MGLTPRTGQSDTFDQGLANATLRNDINSAPPANQYASIVLVASTSHVLNWSDGECFQKATFQEIFVMMSF